MRWEAYGILGLSCVHSAIDVMSLHIDTYIDIYIYAAMWVPGADGIHQDAKGVLMNRVSCV